MAESLRTHRDNLGDAAPLAADLLEQIVGMQVDPLRLGSLLVDLVMYLNGWPGEPPQRAEAFDAYIESQFDQFVLGQAVRQGARR